LIRKFCLNLPCSLSIAHFFAAEDIHDAEYISKLLDTRTLRVTGASISTQTQGHSESKNYHPQAVPLLRPEEAMKLPQHQSLIMRTGHAPIIAKQFTWYRENAMKHLLVESITIPMQTLHINLQNRLALK
jgi:type IV secretion system protein VirD4